MSICNYVTCHIAQQLLFSCVSSKVSICYYLRFESGFRFIPLLIASKALYMTRSHINVPSQKFPVPKINMQTKSHTAIGQV